MHPLFARRAFSAYLVFWAGLSVVPCLVLDSRTPAAAAVLMLATTVAFAFFTLPTFYLCRTLPLDRGRDLRVLSIHGAAAAVWSLIFVVIVKLLAELFGCLPAWSRLPEEVSLAEGALFSVGALFYLLVAASHYVLVESEHRREAAEREGDLALQAQRAELQALRAQVHPHFLFNSLNTVSALIGYDPPRAREACVLLAEYLRGTLRAQEQALVPLREEWALCERYLKVEALRLGERLRVEVELDARAGACLIPSLLLQPLVENAVTHAVTPVETPERLRVRAERRAERLSIVLENGVDPAPRQRDGGVGLRNVRARLAAQYGDDATLRIEKDGARFAALLDMPARTLDTEAAP